MEGTVRTKEEVEPREWENSGCPTSESPREKVACEDYTSKAIRNGGLNCAIKGGGKRRLITTQWRQLEVGKMYDLKWFFFKKAVEVVCRDHFREHCSTTRS